MNIKDIIAISGVPGLSRLVTSRNNGLVLENLDTGKSRFYSVRKHQFTPLETVAIYTMIDTTELRIVFETMMKKNVSIEIPAPNAAPQVLMEYFEQILPEYDRDRVYTSDIKKIIKWYNKLEEKGLLTTSDEEE